jgi:hypothetical protein
LSPRPTPCGALTPREYGLLERLRDLRVLQGEYESGEFFGFRGVEIGEMRDWISRALSSVM